MEELKGHTVRSYDKDLKSISHTINDSLELIIKSIDMVEETIKEPKESFVEKITNHDYKINHLDSLLERKVTSMLALRQPMAVDLRYIVSAIKVSSNLERIGDKAKSIIKKIFYFDQKFLTIEVKNSLFKMLNIAKSMVIDSIDAFNNHDIDKAKEVLRKDDKIDNICHEMFNLLDHDSFSREQVKMLINVLLIAKSFERLADHSSNIAEITTYVITGEIIE